jgi:hypothetical protein
MSRLALLALTAVTAAVIVPAVPAGAASGTVLRLDGIGPLQLGMTRVAALDTGWLAGRRAGCPLAGPPVPITYGVSGSKAPRGIRGVAEFRFGRLRTLSFTRGVRTTAGVAVGKTTPARMVSRYRSAGFTASSAFVDTFGGTFVTVKRRGRLILGGFAERGVVTTLAIPAVATCE